jgi:DNA gyrase subunit A
MSKKNNFDSIKLTELVKEEYRNYQIYSLMDRAIPYLQDGLKPSQRRILYTLWKNQSKGLMKVSSVTGLVLTLHPHGPASIESSIVNLAQDYTFSNNYPLIDKKGYFGERMEPSPAAARYIECKLGKIADYLLFDDMNQVTMIPNYDDKVMEPLCLLPKLPLMLLNGAEGIGTGFSSTIPSYHHKDIVASMIECLQSGKPKKIKPFVNYYTEKIQVDKNNKIIFPMGMREIDGKIYITELPKGFDAKKIYKHLNRYIESGYLKDFIDSSVDNQIEIELIFKRGADINLDEVYEEIGQSSSIVANFTLISERGVKIYQNVEDIIELFTWQRFQVVKRRYELLIEETEKKLLQNNEIIRFIKEKHYAQAEKMSNRKAFVEYLNKNKFTFSEYLADMAIYRMTKEEVAKRLLYIDEDTAALKEYRKVLSSEKNIKEKLVAELEDVDAMLSKWLVEKAKEKKEVYKKKKS